MVTFGKSSCKSEIPNLEVISLNEDVGRLQVPMNEAILMNVLDSREDLAEKAEVLLPIHLPMLIVKPIRKASP